MGEDSSDSPRREREGGDPADDPNRGRSTDDREIVTRSIDPSSVTAEYDFLEIVAELEGRDIEDLPSLYTQVDHFVETLFEDPPAPEAQMRIEFSYAGYRITIDHRGQVTLVPVKDTIAEQ